MENSLTPYYNILLYH